MKKSFKTSQIITIGIVCGLLLLATLFAGCTSSAPAQPVTHAESTTAVPATTVPGLQSTPQAISTTAAPGVLATTSTPEPVYTYSEGNVIAYTAASLKGVSSKLAEGFSKMYPGHKITFNLDGTQALTTQIENGAYADVFISASPKYTTELTKGGYFQAGTVSTLTTNYVIVILPADNPANIRTLADLAKPGVKIARAAKTVPVGIATDAALANLAKSTYGQAWNNSVNTNTVTYETSEPAVATKVALGEVDAGFVYESTATAAKPGTYVSVTIPKNDNYLQVYSIAVLKESTSKGAAADFENFMLSGAGQQILKDYGFRSA
ncbi:MAG: molybdate ABC transporter substrate-binding protein [Methanomicrobiales archaeon HGW-Methanomicrobiales-1]|nr:MAG: molybdate ABC transporter substrate-binding protein [Methanomicrobiales archaeon HGW-Methanomicrobiales-1]